MSATTILAALAPAAVGRQAADLDHAVLAAVADSLGDVGAVAAYHSIGYPEMTNTVAFQRATEIFEVTGQMTADLADGLALLCTQYGLATCAAAVSVDSLSVNLTTAAQSIEDGDYAAAGVALAEARARLADVMSAANEDTFDAVRDPYVQALAALDAATDVLSVIANPGMLQESLDYIGSVRADGYYGLLSELQVPADFAWPAGFAGTQLIDTENFVGKWTEGTSLEVGLSHSISQNILDTWEGLGAQGVIDTFGGSVLLAQIHQAGSKLGESMYLLADLVNGGVECDPWCPDECDTDADCGGCEVEAVGIGLALYNPDEAKTTKTVVALMLAIDVTRRGVTPPGLSDTIKDGVKDAYSDLVDKLLAKSGHMYALMHLNICEASWCYLFWWEYKCKVAKAEWIKLDLPFLQLSTRPTSWNQQMWDKAAEEIADELDEWCADQGG